MSSLNIYRLSGLHNANGVSSTSGSAIWTAGTNTLDNTRAANFILAKINATITELEYTTDEVAIAELMNAIDVLCVCIHALESAAKDKCKLIKSGAVIQAMINDEQFISDSIDSEYRENSIDELVAVFDNFYITETYVESGLFVDWWQINIVANNYNATPGAATKLREYEKNAVGSIDPNDYKDLSSYVADNGAYFLYMFIGEEKIKSYNNIIRERYKKELEVYKYICIQCVGCYSEESVYDMLYTGCTAHYSMTPESKIAQLESLGSDYKIGEVLLITVLTAITLILSILTTLWAILDSVFQFTVSIPDDVDTGVPNADDWDIASYKTSSTSSVSPLLIFGGAAALIYFTTKPKNKR